MEKTKCSHVNNNMTLKIMSSKLLNRFGHLIINFSIAIDPSPFAIRQKRVKPWFEVNGDKTHRLYYDLDRESVVFDVGGYKGQWASDIFSMYCCTVYIFEPVTEFADRIQRRFAKNKKLIVNNFGLSRSNDIVKISVNRDSSSVYKEGGSKQDAIMIKASDFINEHSIHWIDLMKINIEGGEYDLLEHLLEEDLVQIIKDVQVQFHDFIPHANERMRVIQQSLSKTHYLTYQYPFVWENWRLKGS